MTIKTTTGQDYLITLSNPVIDYRLQVFPKLYFNQTITMNNKTIDLNYDMKNQTGTISYYSLRGNRSANFRTFDDQFASAKVAILGGVKIVLHEVGPRFSQRGLCSLFGTICFDKVVQSTNFFLLP